MRSGVCGYDATRDLRSGQVALVFSIRGQQGQLRLATHVVRTQCRLVDASDDRGTTRSANACSGERVGVAHTFSCKLVNMRRNRFVIPKTPNVGTNIFARDPNDVGVISRVRVGQGRETQEQKQELLEHHSVHMCAGGRSGILVAASTRRENNACAAEDFRAPIVAFYQPCESKRRARLPPRFPSEGRRL